MKIYKVDIQMQVMVLAESNKDAEGYALENISEIVDNDGNHAICIASPVTSESQLGDWRYALPYCDYDVNPDERTCESFL